MALNRLLWYSLNQRTSLQENHVGVKLDPDNDERAVFFKIDCDEFRKYFGVADGVKLCDGLIFYRKRGEAPRFIFVELKSDDVGNAEKQIKSTANIVVQYIPKKLQPQAVVIGLIVLRSGVPSSRNRRDKDGKKVQKSDCGMKIKQKGGVKGNADLRDCDVL